MSEQVAREDCFICWRKVGSGLGEYPWMCGNGHTLYHGGGLGWGFRVRPDCWEPPMETGQPTRDMMTPSE